jgi:microcystin-dependent protein
MSNSALGSQSVALLTLPAGTLIDYAGTVEPSGWMLCDGRAVSRTVYASLFSALGTAYGTGDGSTTFNIPDFRGRFARYMDNMGTAQGAASRDTGRVRGTDQTQATKLPTIPFTGSTGGNTNNVWQFTGSGLDAYGQGATTAAPMYHSESHTHSVTISGGGDAETRPINLSCNKLIKI